MNNIMWIPRYLGSRIKTKGTVVPPSQILIGGTFLLYSPQETTLQGSTITVPSDPVHQNTFINEIPWQSREILF